MFEQFLDTVRTFTQQNLPIVIGGGVAVVVLSIVFVMTYRRRTKLDPAALAPPSSTALTQEKALSWAPPEQSYADRRGAVRREGAAVRVVLSSPTLRNGVNEGFVLDRSTGGLRIAITTALAPGSTVQVRAENAPDTIGFVTVIVRSCRKTGDHFELGCEFDKTPPWNVLLLFG